jgi:hypothetical protein
MAKKSRKARRAPKMYPKGAPTSSTVRMAPGQDEVEVEEPEAQATLTSSELRDEYWYVSNDLKRIAMISGILFAVLIVLAFVI